MKLTAQLIQPNITYKQSFLDAIAEYEQSGKPLQLGRSYDEVKRDFASYVQWLQSTTSKTDVDSLPLHRQVYWLVDQKQYIGRVLIKLPVSETRLFEIGHIGYSIRPSKRQQGYGTLALTLGLHLLRETQGVSKAILTCREDNVASLKIIHSHGGELKTSVQPDKNSPKILVFEIPTA